MRKEADHWSEFWFVAKVYLVFQVIAICLFVYVELTVEDAKTWWDLTASVCPILKVTDMLHYHSINATGYGLYIPAYYLIKALNFSKFKFLEPYDKK